MMGFGLLLTLGVAAAVAYALGWRPQNGGLGRPTTHDEALEILRQRYARGEISREEYEQAREVLR